VDILLDGLPYLSAAGNVGLSASTEAQRLAWAPGHLTGVVPADAERALLVAFTSLALVFAGRKYTQAVKDDIGDKSVFTCAPRSGAVSALLGAGCTAECCRACTSHAVAGSLLCCSRAGVERLVRPAGWCQWRAHARVCCII
jgi:hypothetical protein